jgi:hypothetical protein
VRDFIDRMPELERNPLMNDAGDARPVQPRGRRGKLTDPGKDVIPDKPDPRAGAINPELLTLGVGHFLRDDVMPTVRDVARGLREAKDDFQRLFAPAARGDDAQAQAHIVRENAADLARRQDIAEAALRVARKFFAPREALDNHDFVNRIETGQAQNDLHAQSSGR